MVGTRGDEDEDRVRGKWTHKCIGDEKKRHKTADANGVENRDGECIQLCAVAQRQNDSDRDNREEAEGSAQKMLAKKATEIRAFRR